MLRIFATQVQNDRSRSQTGIQRSLWKKKIRYCPFCDSNKHTINSCGNFKILTTDQKRSWIRDEHRCFRCGRAHMARNCDLKRKCPRCRARHVPALHDLSPGQKRDKMKRFILSFLLLALVSSDLGMYDDVFSGLYI